MSDLLAALKTHRASDLKAAVTAQRWLELTRHPSEEMANLACWGLARLATFENDWAVADALLDLEGPEPLAAAIRTASVLDAKAAIPRLRARLELASPQLAVGILRTLDTLGDDARLSLSAERIEEIDKAAFDTRLFNLVRENRPAELIASAAVTETTDRWKSLLDRKGGTSEDLTLLASIAGDGSLTPEDVEAWRRRDVVALTRAIDRLTEFDVAQVPARDVREVELRRAVALACRETIAETQPRRAELDAFAAAGLIHATMARSRSRPDAFAALALAFLGDARVWETTRKPTPEALEALRTLAARTSPRAREAVVACALGWRLPEFANDVVTAAQGGSLLWGFVHAQLATRIEASLLAALDEVSESDVTFSLVSQLASTESEERIIALAATEELATRLYLPLAVKAFPTPRVLDAVRRAPPLGDIELRRRFQLLVELDPLLASLDLEAAALFCHDCGAIWNVAAESLAQVGRVLVPDPAVACPGCGLSGSATGADPTQAPRQWRVQPTFEPFESPRMALDRFAQDPTENAVDLVETLLLCGEGEQAVAALQLVSFEDRLAQAPRLGRLLLALEQPNAAKEVLVAALTHADAWAVWSEEDVARLGTALAEACASLGEEVPVIEPPTPEVPGLQDVSIPSAKVGRNEPCPCGSGKKYKKCHGA